MREIILSADRICQIRANQLRSPVSNTTDAIEITIAIRVVAGFRNRDFTTDFVCKPDLLLFKSGTRFYAMLDESRMFNASETGQTHDWWSLDSLRRQAVSGHIVDHVR